MYSHLLGIQLGLSGKIVISPSLSKKLSFAKGEYASKNGVIKVEWKAKNDCFTVKIQADKGVEFGYDFGEREILSVKKLRGGVVVVVK